MNELKLSLKQKILACCLVGFFGYGILANIYNSLKLFDNEEIKQRRITLNSKRYLAINEESALDYMIYRFYHPDSLVEIPKKGHNFEYYSGIGEGDNVHFLEYSRFENGEIILRDSSRPRQDTLRMLVEKFNSYKNEN